MSPIKKGGKRGKDFTTTQASTQDLRNSNLLDSQRMSQISPMEKKKKQDEMRDLRN